MSLVSLDVAPRDSMRKSFVFSVEAAQKLERLTKVCRLDSLSNTIRLALTVLEELVTVIQKGGVIITRDANGQERFYHPLLEQDPNVVVPTAWFSQKDKPDAMNS
jgi:hypothetical protein